jgi:sugar O-acyltransferase (sialic acid O-acetyltransferase NeuD family)
VSESTNIIYCAGDQGRVVVDILDREEDKNNNIVFIDDTLKAGTEVNGVKIVGSHEALEEFDPNIDSCIVAFGGRQTSRLDLVRRIEEYGFDFYKVVDPDTTLSSTASISEGSIVNARTYVGPDVVIESHALVDSCVNVSHDTHIQEGATITPGVTLAGGVTVGKGSYIGAGATVVDEVSIEEGATVGAGSVVINDVQTNATVTGIPATET